MEVKNSGISNLLDNSNMLVPAIGADTEDLKEDAIEDTGDSSPVPAGDTTENQMDTVPLQGWLCYPAD